MSPPPDTLDTILVWETYRAGPGNPNDDVADAWVDWDVAGSATGWWSTKPLANQPPIAEAPRKPAAKPVAPAAEPEKQQKIPMASPIRTDMEVFRF